jgi:hypothetical protein
MTWLFFKVTLFYGDKSVSSVAYNETDALIAANAQLPAGAIPTGKRTERVPLTDEEKS